MPEGDPASGPPSKKIWSWIKVLCRIAVDGGGLHSETMAKGVVLRFTVGASALSLCLSVCRLFLDLQDRELLVRAAERGSCPFSAWGVVCSGYGKTVLADWMRECCYAPRQNSVTVSSDDYDQYHNMVRK